MTELKTYTGHTPGLCDVIQIPHCGGSGAGNIVTCGADGKICVRHTSNINDVLQVIDNIPEGETAPTPTSLLIVDPQGTGVCVADDDGAVKVGMILIGGTFVSVAVVDIDCVSGCDLYRC